MKSLLRAALALLSGLLLFSLTACNNSVVASSVPAASSVAAVPQAGTASSQAANPALKGELFPTGDYLGFMKISNAKGVYQDYEGDELESAVRVVMDPATGKGKLYLCLLDEDGNSLFDLNATNDNGDLLVQGTYLGTEVKGWRLVAGDDGLYTMEGQYEEEPTEDGVKPGFVMNFSLRAWGAAWPDGAPKPDANTLSWAAQHTMEEYVKIRGGKLSELPALH